MYFLNNFLIFKYFFYVNSQGQHVKFESITIIKSEEILVLMEALLKHVCTDNFVQDEAISIKIVASLGIIVC